MDSCCFPWLAAWLLPPAISYREACQRVCSLDLVYFCQFGKWTGPFVALFSGKMITHMGIVWKDQRNGELYLLESIRNPDGAHDVLQNGRAHTGVRLVSFREMLDTQTHGSFVCIQPIQMERALRASAERVFDHFIVQKNGVPFEHTVSSFLLTQLPPSWRLRGGREDTSTLFCSELVALALRECGLLVGVDNVSAVYPSTLYECQLAMPPGAHLSGHKFLVHAAPRVAARRRPVRQRPERAVDDLVPLSSSPPQMPPFDPSLISDEDMLVRMFQSCSAPDPVNRISV